MKGKDKRIIQIPCVDNKWELLDRFCKDHYVTDITPSKSGNLFVTYYKKQGEDNE